MYASNYFENLMLNLMRNQSVTAPVSLNLALFQSSPGDDGTSGQEVSYTGYARQPITFSAPAVSGSGMVTQNTDMISFPEAPASAGQVNFVAVFDSGSNMYLYGQLDTPLSIQAGVSPVFRAGTVKWIWSGNLTNYYRTIIINILRGTDASGFNPYVALCNGDPENGGQELTGSGYSRMAATMSAPTQQASGAAMSQNETDMSSSIATGSWGTLNTVAICDASTAGNAFAVIPLTSTYNITSGYTVGFRAGELQFSIN